RVARRGTTPAQRLDSGPVRAPWFRQIRANCPGQLHIKDRRQATRGSSKEAKRPANLEAINLHLDLRWLRAAPSLAHELLGPSLRRVVKKRSVEDIDEREKQRFPLRNLTGTDNSRRRNSRVIRSRTSQEPDLVHLPLGTMLTRGIRERVHVGW